MIVAHIASRFARFVARWFGILFLLAFLLGVFLKPVSSYFGPFVEHTLMLVMFLNFLKLDSGAIFQEIRNYRYQAYLPHWCWSSARSWSI
ncbi:MAG: hypothetical protein HY519_00270 [Candidatus Aenigmarchaeota archaeon]|nr:hypothetical protein [Candidatus Aenigmarchaeota archaeon]